MDQDIQTFRIHLQKQGRELQDGASKEINDSKMPNEKISQDANLKKIQD